MDYMRNNGVYLDESILRKLAENIYKQYDNNRGIINSNYGMNWDIGTLTRPKRFQVGYYDLTNVPIHGSGNVDIQSMLDNWFSRGR